MKVSDIMKTPVVVVQKNRPISQVMRIFEEKQIHAIPVLAMDGTIEGIVSSSDLTRTTDETQPVESVMTARTHVISPNSRIEDAAKMMEKFNVHHLVAMDNGQVVGIVSAMDFVKYIAQLVH